MLMTAIHQCQQLLIGQKFYLLDVWLNVDETEVRYVADIIPTLSWQGGLIGIRLILSPRALKNCNQHLLIPIRLRRNIQKRFIYGQMTSAIFCGKRLAYSLQ